MSDPCTCKTMLTGCLVHPRGFTAYRIEPTSCVCGGNIAWLGQRPTGAWEMIGCVCHQTPLALVGRTLEVYEWSEGRELVRPHAPTPRP
jgi:hypothetical protein